LACEAATSAVHDALRSTVASADQFGIAFLALIDNVERIGIDTFRFQFFRDFGFQVVAGFPCSRRRLRGLRKAAGTHKKQSSGHCPRFHDDLLASSEVYRVAEGKMYYEGNAGNYFCGVLSIISSPPEA
jgi:hypothetical protein